MYPEILITHRGLSYLSRIFALAICCCHFTQGIQAEVTRVSEFSQTQALAMMKRPEPESRAITYQACRQLGAEGKSVYHGLLEDARNFHLKKIEDSIGLASEEANHFSSTLMKLREHREFTMHFTLTELEKDTAKLADLKQAHHETQLWFKEAKDQHGRATASMQVIHSSASALDEIRRELAYCGGKQFTIGQRTFDRILSKHSNAASNLHDRLAEIVGFHESRTTYEVTTQHNRAQTWATSEMRSFADLLNERRQTLGLPILRLERRLSQASDMHSQEMARLRYFDHISPVKENATPDLRAKNSRYPGTFVGENIYFYAKPRGASMTFDAWWQSDGHRFVLFNPKPNEIGLSNRNGTHWTMMTGLAPQPKKELKSAQAK